MRRQPIIPVTSALFLILFSVDTYSGERQLSGYGHRQIEQMLEDHPNMRGVVARDSKIRKWSERQFEGEHTGRRVYWDHREPRSGDPAEGGPYRIDYPPYIRITSDPAVSGASKWMCLIFELHDRQFDGECAVVRDFCLRLGRKNFVTIRASTEHAAAVKAKEFFKRHPFPFDEKQRSTYGWFLFVPSNLRDYLLQHQERLAAKQSNRLARYYEFHDESVRLSKLSFQDLSRHIKEEVELLKRPLSREVRRANRNYAKRQLEQILVDRPRMSGVIAQDHHIWQWAEKQFEGQANGGNRIYWDNRNTLSGCGAESGPVSGDYPPYVRVEDDPKKSGIDQWTSLVFELHNSQADEPYLELINRAAFGKIGREAFAVACMKLEFEAMAKTQKLLRQHPLRAAKTGDDPVYNEYTGEIGDFDDFLRKHPRSPDPRYFSLRDHYLEYYDELASFQKRRK